MKWSDFAELWIYFFLIMAIASIFNLIALETINHLGLPF